MRPSTKDIESVSRGLTVFKTTMTTRMEVTCQGNPLGFVISLRRDNHLPIKTLCLSSLVGAMLPSGVLIVRRKKPCCCTCAALHLLAPFGLDGLVGNAVYRLCQSRDHIEARNKRRHRES
jgi:hypothetical protein